MPYLPQDDHERPKAWLGVSRVVVPSDFDGLAHVVDHKLGHELDNAGQTSTRKEHIRDSTYKTSAAVPYRIVPYTHTSAPPKRQRTTSIAAF